MELTKQDKYYIAEFLFSNDHDTLIKSDSEKVIKVFKKHLPELVIEMDAESVCYAIKSNISDEEISSILDEYLSGTLNP